MKAYVKSEKSYTCKELVRRTTLLTHTLQTQSRPLYKSDGRLSCSLVG